MSNTISLVVDADIARSSGTTEHPVSRNSRESLEFIKENELKLAICPTLMKEWKEHRSLFARKWLASMFARKQVLTICPSSETRNRIYQTKISDKEVNIALKDAHLIDSALHVDKVILSNDDNARKVYCIISDTFQELKEIRWFNVINEKEQACECIMKKSYLTPSVYFLGYDED